MAKGFRFPAFYRMSADSQTVCPLIDFNLPVGIRFTTLSILQKDPMRAVLQRVSSAAVRIDGVTHASIGAGLLVLLGVEESDTAADVDWLASKIAGVRLFGGEGGPWSRSISELGGEILLVSQFTLHASTKKGTKPSWHRAAKPESAIPLYESMIGRLETLLGRKIATGRFGAMMNVELVNDGPVTVIIDSKARE